MLAMLTLSQAAVGLSENVSKPRPCSHPAEAGGHLRASSPDAPLLSKGQAAPRSIRNRALLAMVAHSVVESYRSVVRGAPFKSGEVSKGPRSPDRNTPKRPRSAPRRALRRGEIKGRKA